MTLRCLILPSAAAVLAFHLLPSLSGQTEAEISSGSVAVTVGDTFSIPVSIANVVDLFDFQFNLGFDPTLLQLQNVTEGPFLSDAGTTNFFPGFIDNTAGNVMLVLDSLSGMIPGASGSGSLANLSFEAIGAGVSPLTLSSVILQDSTSGDIPFTTFNGSAAVSSPTVPEPPAWTWIAPLFCLFTLWRRTRLCASIADGQLSRRASRTPGASN